MPNFTHGQCAVKCSQCLYVQQSPTKIKWAVTGSMPQAISCAQVSHSSDCDNSPEVMGYREVNVYLCVICCPVPYHGHSFLSELEWSGFQLPATEMVLSHRAGCGPVTTGLCWTSCGTAWLRKGISAGNVVTSKPLFLPPIHDVFQQTTEIAKKGDLKAKTEQLLWKQKKPRTIILNMFYCRFFCSPCGWTALVRLTCRRWSKGYLPPDSATSVFIHVAKSEAVRAPDCLQKWMIGYTLDLFGTTPATPSQGESVHRTSPKPEWPKTRLPPSLRPRGGVLVLYHAVDLRNHW